MSSVGSRGTTNPRGIVLKIVIDDDIHKQGTPFHEFEIRSPRDAATTDIDAVLITTCVFQDEIYDRIRFLEDAGVTIECFG